MNVFSKKFYELLLPAVLSTSASHSGELLASSHSEGCV